MKTILVATDFSAVSRNATVYAAQLAKALGAKIILFHTYNIPTTVMDIAFMMVSVEEMQKENEDRIKKDADRLFASFGVEVEWLVRIGIPSDEIKILADEKNADLIIMAVSGEGASNKFIGSTTLNTLQKSKQPVLTIPHNANFNKISKVIYATDLSYLAKPELFLVLFKIIKVFGANLHVLHIQVPGKKLEEEANAKQKLDALFQDIDHEFSIMDAESIMLGINQFSQKNKPDLLVMTAHKHNFLERIFGKNYTREMLHETTIPLLVLHDKE